MPTIQELEQKVKDLQKERQGLKRELEVFKEKEDFINDSVVRSKEAFDIANLNSQKIIMKSLDLMTTLNNRLNKFLDDLDNAPSETEIWDLTNKFIKANRKYFFFDEEEKEEVAIKIKDKIIAHTRA